MMFSPAVQLLDTPSPLAWRLFFVAGKLLLPAVEGAALAPVPVLDFEPTASSRHYLGRLDGLDCWAITLADVPDGWQPMALRAAMMQMPAPLLNLAVRAAQIVEWDRTHRYCGACATPTEHKPGERARVCPSCGQLAYPRLSPAMMALVWREGELLLARSPGFTPGIYSALAGFVEPGETLEECVVREVEEEVGLQVSDLRYYGSQSWPFPHSFMLAFTARWVGGEIVPQAGEIEHAAWFPLDGLPGIPPRFSIAGHLIRDTVAAMQGAAS
ncbi:NAD(+) diphosphatase [Chitinimonas viridis]|uniref:NAD(+) diphosphatase n=1 Tax=Chitinimonas viridis TaxID=664880 RepID=A0ABT8B2L8_9NEIS|nr:NAD(+) diphosphatase [Chitinimonas viridis]MDN3576274.1 NAD(+) diphosphatase [Chitinimonas viridis]